MFRKIVEYVFVALVSFLIICSISEAVTTGGTGNNNEDRIPGNMRVINPNITTKKGDIFSEKLIFRKETVSQGSEIFIDFNILLDYTVKTGNVYTAVKNRSQALDVGSELSDIIDFYVDWIWYFCGEIQTVTAYSPSEDGDGVVIGKFTLDANFDNEPVTGSNIRLIDPDEIDEVVDTTVIHQTPEGQIQLGTNSDIGVIHNNEQGFVKYFVTDETSQAFPLIIKPVKDDSVNVSTFCFIFAPVAALQDTYVEKFGIFLDSVPANTKARIYLLGSDELDDRYPIVENVTLDEFNQGLGDDVIVSTYADESTWNLIQMSDPKIIKIEEAYNLVFSFSDNTGDPVFLDVPVDTSATDSVFFRTVRSDNIQSASGTSITLDTDASSRDDDYNGMRLYIGGEFRDITDYNGTTKVATVDSVYTSAPSPSDAYDIKIAFLSPLAIFEYKETLKGKIQDKHNRRFLDVSNDGDEIEIGTVISVDTTGGAITLTVPLQFGLYKGGWFDIIDEAGTFNTNNVSIDFSPGEPTSIDLFRSADVDAVLDEDNVTYHFFHRDFATGWDFEKSNVKTYGEMFQFDEANTITIDTQDVFFEVGGFSVGETSNIIFQNGNELKITTEGMYEIDYSVDWTNGVNTVYKFRIAINGTTEGKTQSGGRRGNAADIVSGSSQGILDLSVDDIITLEVLNATNTNNITVTDANVIINKIDGN